MTASRPQEGPTSAVESTNGTQPDQNPVRRNLGNTKSFRKAINAMCSHCVGCTADEIEPGFRDDIRSCSAPACPLWNFRPFQAKEKGTALTVPSEIVSPLKDTANDYIKQ